MANDFEPARNDVGKLLDKEARVGNLHSSSTLRGINSPVGVHVGFDQPRVDEQHRETLGSEYLVEFLCDY